MGVNEEPNLLAAVLHVHDLQRSAHFYTQLLGLEVARRQPEAVLLTNRSGQCQLALRQRSTASHSANATVQGLVWHMGNRSMLDEHERRLAALGARRDRHTGPDENTTIVATQDPDGQRLMLVHQAGPDDVPAEIPLDVFVWY
jgi:catechol 2,3-dioxygenase-like lactoylglutathione lyase family enzyme